MKNQNPFMKPIRFFMLNVNHLESNLIGFCAVLGFILISTFAIGQDQTQKSAETGLGNGLNFSLSENQYEFKISGFLQPTWQMSKLDTLKAENTFRSKRSYLNFGGKALKEKLSFFVQIDFGCPHFKKLRCHVAIYFMLIFIKFNRDFGKVLII